jgi:hypothetical protein
MRWQYFQLFPAASCGENSGGLRLQDNKVREPFAAQPCIAQESRKFSFWWNTY